MAPSASRPSARRLAALGAALALSAGTLGLTAGCGGSPGGSSRSATETGAPLAASARAAGQSSSAASSGSMGESVPGPGPDATGSDPAGTDATGGSRAGASGAGAPSDQAAGGTSRGSQAAPSSGGSGVAPGGSPAPSALPPYRPVGGVLDGLDCRAQVHSAVGASLFLHEFEGRTGALVEMQGTLAFEPVLLGHGGGVGDIASGLESYVATDAQGRLHYLQVELLRENTSGPVVATVDTDAVLGSGYGAATAIGASIVGHAGGDPELFVVDGEGRLLRHTVTARGTSVTLSAPSVLATGLGHVTAMDVDVFDPDGDLAQEKDSATRVVVVDGDVVRQMVVRRDGSHDSLTAVVGSQADLTGARAVTRMWCARPGGPMVDQGALVVFTKDGVGRVFAGTYTPAVASPKLTDLGRTDAVKGRLAG